MITSRLVCILQGTKLWINLQIAESKRALDLIWLIISLQIVIIRLIYNKNVESNYH